MRHHFPSPRSIVLGGLLLLAASFPIQAEVLRLQLLRTPPVKTARAIEQDLREFEGVASLRFDFNRGTLTVYYDHGVICPDYILEQVNSRSPDGDPLVAPYEEPTSIEALATLEAHLDHIGKRFEGDRDLGALRKSVRELRFLLEPLLTAITREHREKAPGKPMDSVLKEAAQALSRVVVSMEQTVMGEDDGLFEELLRVADEHSGTLRNSLEPPKED